MEVPFIKGLINLQKLQFEQAWNKTISQNDRHAVEQLFQQTVLLQEDYIACPIFRQAINHKNEMLVTVLIHNFSDQELIFENRNVHCLLDDGQVTQNFTIQALRIPEKTSMPWTFIFEDCAEFLFAKLLEVKIEE